MNTQVRSTYPITAPVVGISFDGRQKIAAKLMVGEVVYLVRDSHNSYDFNAIKVENRAGCQIGFLSRDLAATLSASFDHYGEPVLARVEAILGGYSEWSNLGVRIQFHPPEDH